MRVRKTLVVAAILLAAFLTLAAAHVDFGIAVGSPPPPPPPVVAGPVGVAPGPDYVWVPGYWDWAGGQWVWVDGKWILPPRGHRVWVAPMIDFRLHRGHWR